MSALAALALTVAPLTTAEPAAAAAASTSCTGTTQAAVQKRILTDVNAARAKAGKGAMTLNGDINRVQYSAQIPAGWRGAAENVAYGYSPSAVTAGWMDSPGHRANILGAYNRIGIGVACDSNGRAYYTQVFGRYAVKNFAAVTPKISGTVRVGQTVEAVRGTWATGTAYSYRWLRNGAAISGATKKTYAITAKDRGARLSVKVTGKRSGYNTASRTSAAATVR
ncbi:CAP domain-containing protein [Microbacterium sp.]|uniref:CAP domain-containing protein n=1 Tax=Microbacterium sp. TaxID=51671 RepID=UPI00373647D5